MSRTYFVDDDRSDSPVPPRMPTPQPAPTALPSPPAFSRWRRGSEPNTHSNSNTDSSAPHTPSSTHSQPRKRPMVHIPPELIGLPFSAIHARHQRERERVRDEERERDGELPDVFSLSGSEDSHSQDAQYHMSISKSLEDDSILSTLHLPTSPTTPRAFPVNGTPSSPSRHSKSKSKSPSRGHLRRPSNLALRVVAASLSSSPPNPNPGPILATTPRSPARLSTLQPSSQTANLSGAPRSRSPLPPLSPTEPPPPVPPLPPFAQAERRLNIPRRIFSARASRTRSRSRSPERSKEHVLRDRDLKEREMRERERDLKELKEHGMGGLGVAWILGQGLDEREHPTVNFVEVTVDRMSTSPPQVQTGNSRKRRSLLLPSTSSMSVKRDKRERTLSASASTPSSTTSTATSGTPKRTPSSKPSLKSRPRASSKASKPQPSSMASFIIRPSSSSSSSSCKDKDEDVLTFTPRPALPASASSATSTSTSPSTSTSTSTSASGYTRAKLRSFLSLPDMKRTSAKARPSTADADTPSVPSPQSQGHPPSSYNPLHSAGTSSASSTVSKSSDDRDRSSRSTRARSGSKRTFS